MSTVKLICSEKCYVGPTRPSWVQVWSLTLIFLASLNVQAAPRCEDLFRKNKFFKPSVEITETGRIETRLTDSTSAIGIFVNSFARLFHRPLGLKKIELVTQKLTADNRENVPFWIKFSEAFGLDIKVDESAFAHIPREGGLVIVSNHPMNGVEGIALAAVISKVRPDVKIVMTPLLKMIPRAAESAIFANPYGGEAARIENVEARKQMEDHMRSGGAMIIFPSGTVSGKNKLSDNYAEDGVWKKGVYDLVRKVPETRVMPIFVEGEPSQTFHRMVKFAESLPRKFKALQIGIGAIFHLREIASRVETEVAMVVGRVYEGAEIRSWGDAAEAMKILRSKTYDLKGVERIAPPGDRKRIQAELSAKAQVIYDMDPNSPTKRMKVYLARGSEIPETLNELGRLREITFRAVGEGTGKSRDIDQYDSSYLHLIVVDKASGDIAGAYRLGLVDQLLNQGGLQALYTSTLVNHSQLLEGNLLNAIELGRSFVVAEYQRSFALLALFNAIGRFIVENPKYKYLIGPVSISNEISDRSKALIMQYMIKFHSSERADLVQALNKSTESLQVHAEDINFLQTQPNLKELSSRVKAIESSLSKNSTLPPLIPIYISLGAKVFTFNFDKDFNSYDGFILVDLTQLTVEQLKNYMSEDGAAHFLNYHNHNR